jgi:hypothetical protein
MAFYENFINKTTDAQLTSLTGFTNAPNGTQFLKNTGDVYEKVSTGIYKRVDPLEPPTTGPLSIGDGAILIEGSNISFDANLLPTSDATYNIGAAGLRWNEIHAVINEATYADIAEKYETDEEYEDGTILEVGGEKEGTLYNGGTLLGIVSGLPAFRMNADGEGQYIALKGKVPVKCINDVKKGQYCIAKEAGMAEGKDKADLTQLDYLNIVGVALEDSVNGMVNIKV